MHNGPHDVGGLLGFGEIDRHEHARAYPEGWEDKVIAAIIALIVGGVFNVDQQRARIEELPTSAYWAVGYYRRWLHSLERLLLLTGTLTDGEITDRLEAIVSGTYRAVERDDPELMAAIDDLIVNGAPLHREVDGDPRFSVGDRVRTRTIVVEERGVQHTRLPGYAQDRAGVIERVYPAMTLPDANVSGRDDAEYVYAVAFGAADLWPDGDPSAQVVIDLFESYMDPEDS